MFIDLRYHIVTVVAVFLALGIGIFVGTVMVGNEPLIQQQQLIIDRLESDFEHLREAERESNQEIAGLQEIVENHEVFSQQVLPLLIENRLQGKVVGIVSVSDTGQTAQVLETLEMAGAEVISVTQILSDKIVKEPAILQESKNEDVDTSEANIGDILAEDTNNLIMIGESSPFLESLQEKSYIKISGIYGTKLDALVFIGSSQNQNSSNVEVFDLPFISYLQDSDMDLYVCESSATPVSGMEYYQLNEVTTVDNIDTVYGCAALVLSMEGRPGHYGIKVTAERLLPVLES